MALATFKVQYLKDAAKKHLQPICHDINVGKVRDDKNYKKALSLATAEQKRVYGERADEIDSVSKEVNRLKLEKNALHHIGIAADEAHRCKDDPQNRYPLVEWGITEAQALQICYNHGFDWGGLYEIYHRVSCWCCPLQRVGELRNLRHHHPELWARLLELDRRARAQFGPGPLGQFKKNWSVERYDERFAREDANSG